MLFNDQSTCSLLLPCAVSGGVVGGSEVAVVLTEQRCCEVVGITSAQSLRVTTTRWQLPLLSGETLEGLASHREGATQSTAMAARSRRSNDDETVKVVNDLLHRKITEVREQAQLATTEYHT